MTRFWSGHSFFNVLAVMLCYYLAALQICLNIGKSTASECGCSMAGSWRLTHWMSSRRFSVFVENVLTKKMPWAAQPASSSHERKFCCDKLRKWLNTAIRWHAVCLTKCFLSDTRELLWRLAAWFRVFVRALLRGVATISAVFRVFVTAATPPPRTHGASPLMGLLQLDYIFTLMEPCWISVVVHSRTNPLQSIRQRLFCVTFWHICWYVSFGNRC